MRRFTGLILAACLIASCASNPDSADEAGRDTVHSGVGMGHPAPTPSGRQPGDRPADTAPDPSDEAPPAPAAFASLPGWSDADLYPGAMALKKSCGVFKQSAADAPISANAPWAGRTLDWLPACAAMDVVMDEASARAVIQALFRPVEIRSPDGYTRFTGYFEPVYEARWTPQPPFTEPIPAYPPDLERGSGGDIYQRLPNGTRRAYPDRKAITEAGVRPLAYAHPADVFFLQIQGSGKLVFPDGKTMKAVYASHNGHTFASTANWLMDRGWISRADASMQGIRAWMDRATPEQVRQAMNANPRYIFFTLEAPEDGETGPKGAMGVPLTPLGSVAVDREHNPLGVPMFIQTSAPGLGGDWSGLLVAQDTGGAINGPVRGDIYFGTGKEAGERAGTMNAPGRLWVLLPRAVADRIPGIEAYADLGQAPATP